MKKLMFCAMLVTLGAGALWAEDAYLESDSSAGAGINSRYFFNPKSRIEVDYALTDASIAQARVWGMDATSPMASLYVQGVLNVAFGSGDTFVNSDTLTGLRADTLRHTAILDVDNRQAVYMTGRTRNGAAVAGGEDGDLTVEWEKAKTGMVETYAAVPIYDICGEPSEGAPVTVSVEHLSAGTLLLFR